jgi:hypothetical protein
MRLTISDRVLAGMTAAGISEPRIHDAMTRIFAPAVVRSVVNKAMIVENEWTALKRPLLMHIKTMGGNIRKAPAYLQPVLSTYIQHLRAARNDMDVCASMMVKNPDHKADPNAPPKRLPCVADITRLTARQNSELESRGQLIGPERKARWQTWIAPDVRKQIVRDVEIAYARNGAGSGRRARPFITSDDVVIQQKMLLRLRAFIDDTRRIEGDVDSHGPGSFMMVQGSTPARALQLCAMRMLERALNQWEKDNAKDYMHGIEHPLPVNWMHLLEAPLRKRVLDAREPGATISLEGISDFYAVS